MLLGEILTNRSLSEESAVVGLSKAITPAVTTEGKGKHGLGRIH